MIRTPPPEALAAAHDTGGHNCKTERSAKDDVSDADSRNKKLKQQMESSEQARAFYRLSCEAMIGLALGRATTPGEVAVQHETDVIEMLKLLSRQIAL